MYTKLKYGTAPWVALGRLAGVVCTLWCSSCVQDGANERKLIRIAVATNFQTVAKELADAFENKSGIEVEVSTGSSGKLYAQIVAGAPFDVFLSSDVQRPRLLEAEGRAIVATRFTYAIGQLALHCAKKWREECVRFAGEGRDIARGKSTDPWAKWLRTGGRLAIAEPRVAPYGRAAQQTLLNLGIWSVVRQQVIVGESVGQTFQFVDTGNASRGFVAASQLITRNLPLVLVPPSLYSPIEQQAILLKESRGARAFLRFLRSDLKALKEIEKAGYRRFSESGAVSLP